MTTNRFDHSVGIPKPLYEQLKIAAKERDVSVRWLIRRLLAEAVEQLTPPENLLPSTKPKG